ncbi:hypothetical protein [Chitinophaga sp.]|uniref:hypothetical protein n=1 Tax=Chitinophaga sp. TaxID=1869181 RepID=UPI0031D37C69
MQQHLSVKPLPFFYVGQSITNDRISKFKTQKHPLLTQAIGKPDTCSVWYSKEHFVKLLEEIEFAGGDGIRISFGTYETGHQYEGQTCLLFNTTRQTVVGNTITHTNVILENEPDFAERSAQERDIIHFPGEDPIIKDFNLGSPCPPFCDADGPK